MLRTTAWIVLRSYAFPWSAFCDWLETPVPIGLAGIAPGSSTTVEIPQQGTKKGRRPYDAALSDKTAAALNNLPRAAESILANEWRIDRQKQIVMRSGQKRTTTRG